MENWWLHFLNTTWSITIESAPWVLISLLAGGLVHEFLPTSNLQGLLNRRGTAGLIGAVVVGALLPICSCGVVPLSVSMYRSGVRIGPVMAFTAATPIINPASIILSLGLLGPQITAAYVALGLLLPFVLGVISERWGNVQIHAASLALSATQSPAKPSTDSLGTRVARGIKWGVFDLGPSIGFYLAFGILIGSLTTGLAPANWIKNHLGDGSLFGLAAIAILGASIYVCAWQQVLHRGRPLCFW